MHALISLSRKLTVHERHRSLKHALSLADMLSRREWPSVNKSEWLDNKLPVLLMWEWVCDTIGALLVVPGADVPACSAVIHLLNSLTSRDADASNIRLECVVDLIRKLTAFKSTWQSGGGYYVLAKLLALVSATSEPLRLIELQIAAACTHSMMPCCRLCEAKGMRTRCGVGAKRSCCDAAAADMCVRYCGASASSLMISLTHVRSSHHSVYYTACTRAAALLPSLLRGKVLPFLASPALDADSLRSKISDIFVNSQFPEAVLKLRLFIESLRPKWNASSVSGNSSASAALSSAEPAAAAKYVPVTVGEHAAFCVSNGDVDGLVFNSFLMLLVVFEGSNHFGSSSSVAGTNIDGGAENSSSSSSSKSDSGANIPLSVGLPPFALACHASSVIAAVLRSFRFRGGIEKRSCSLSADVIPRAVFVWLTHHPCIPLEFCGASYEPVKCAAAIVCCVAKGSVSFGSFVVWLLHPALIYMSKRHRSKAVQRLLEVAVAHKRLHSHLDIVSAGDMDKAIEDSAQNDAAIKFWRELVAIVFNGKLGGQPAGLVAEWDAEVVRNMFHEVAPSEGCRVDVAGDDSGVASAGVGVQVSQRNSVAVANEIARIMTEVSLHGTGAAAAGSENSTCDFLTRLSSLFHSHAVACTKFDPFDDINLDTASAATHSSASNHSKHLNDSGASNDDDAFVSMQLLELRATVSSCALSDALIFVQNVAGGSGAAKGSSTAPALQSLMAAQHTCAQFMTRISKFFIAAVETALLLICSGTVPAAAAATVLWKLCPTLTSRYLNHVLLLVPSVDNPALAAAHGLQSRIHQQQQQQQQQQYSPSSQLFAPLDHALPLLHQSSCSRHFHSWADLSGSHSASALRSHPTFDDRSGSSTGLSSNSNVCGAADSVFAAASSIAHHCSSFSVAALLRVLHPVWDLDAAIRSNMAGERVYVQQHELVSLLQEWMCNSAVSGGGDKSIISSGCSSVSAWRCEAFRALNCTFMELACSSSLMLASLGAVAARLLACDSVFQEVSAVVWQQATLQAGAAPSGCDVRDEQKQAKRPCYDYRQQQQQNAAQRETEDISLTDDEDDGANDVDIPNGCADDDSGEVLSRSGSAVAFDRAAAVVEPSVVCTLPGYSSDSCWHKLHAAMLLLPTAVSLFPSPLACLCFVTPLQVGEALHIVRMLSGLVRALNAAGERGGAAALRDDDVAMMVTVGGSDTVLCSCVAALCVLHARVCCMSLAAEMAPQRLPSQQSLPPLLARVRDTLHDAAQVACFSVALACGGGAVYRGIAASVHRALRAAQLPVFIRECSPAFCARIVCAWSQIHAPRCAGVAVACSCLIWCVSRMLGAVEAAAAVVSSPLA